MVLVIGATGNIGSELVGQLLGAQVDTRVGARNIGRAQARLGEGPTYINFDFDLAATYAPALSGVSSLFFIAPHHHPVPSVTTLLAEATKHGVERVIFSSGRTTGDLETRPLHKVETVVKQSGLSWNILRPGWFMQNFTGWIGVTIPKHGKFYIPAGSSNTAFVDVRDIAAVACHLLTGGGMPAQTYNLTSHTAYNHTQVAEMITAAAGRFVEYVDMDTESYVSWALENGWSEADARFTAFLYDEVKTGKEEVISLDVAELLGTPPRSLPAFILENAEFWKAR